MKAQQFLRRKTVGRWFRSTVILVTLAICLIAGIASAQTTVIITASGFPPRTMEPCPVCLVPPVSVTVSRTGSLTQPLSVALRAGGTATSGVDFVPVPNPLVIPAGQASASFFLTPLDDAEVEGPEVVEIAIRPTITANVSYIIGSPGSARVVIGDDEAGAPAERLDFTAPANGAAFASGVAAIQVRALAVSTTREIDQPVEFFANGILIGQSNPVVFGRPPVPWFPRDHDFTWQHPPDGDYILTARTPAAPGQWLEAAPIHITVGPAAVRPRVSIVATERIAEEDSAPTLRPFVLRGLFTISRTGATTNPQPVYLHVSGTAMPGADYTALPFAVTIPAGAASTTVQVTAIPDDIPEPLETVIAEVSNCPPDGLLPPCFDFDIDPAHQRDTVFIRDDGITRATLEITAPLNGAHFSTGQNIAIDCTAIDIDGAMTHIDFYADNQKIGESQLLFLVPPPPGSPIIHTFTWVGAPAGTHTLTTRAITSAGTPVVSTPITIDLSGNQLPHVNITSPASGAQFPSGTPVEIIAAAIDPDGYTDFAEFFADGHKLGEMRLDFLVPPPSGETQTYSFTWRDALPGSHVLSVRVRDNLGARAVSPPVTILVTVPDGLPVVIVRPFDPFGVEPSATLPANPASFRLHRSGSTASTLAVNYALGGSATNGTDYQFLNGTALFPAGSPSVDVIVIPLADNLVEGRETVRLTVVPQLDALPQRYTVGHRNRAIVLIADRSWSPTASGGSQCDAIGSGLFHLCFPAAPLPGFRIEASDDLRHWETLQETAAIENAVHFVDPDSPGFPRRFYRIAEDAAAGSP